MEPNLLSADDIRPHNCTPVYDDGTINAKVRLSINGFFKYAILICIICNRQIDIISDLNEFKKRMKEFDNGRNELP